MTRCPNCGAAIRIGAKFCTSCGFRLTVEDESATPSRSPFATTSAQARSQTPAVGDAVLADDQVIEDDQRPSEASVDEDEVASRPAPIMATTAYTGAGDATADEGEVIEMVAARSDANDQPGRSWYAPVPQTTSGPISDDMVASLEPSGVDQPEPISFGADQATANDPATDDEVFLIGSAATTEEDAPVAMPAATATTDPILPVVEADPVAPHQRAEVETDVASEDPLVEARSLVARLEELLSRIDAGPPIDATETVGGAVPFTSIADDADVDALRGIVASARERPRDVDVMLDLVLRADTIAAVLADRDLLLAALRGDEKAIDDAWSSDDGQPATYPAWGSS